MFLQDGVANASAELMHPGLFPNLRTASEILRLV
jgi:hypothetical protein